MSMRLVQTAASESQARRRSRGQIYAPNSIPRDCCHPSNQATNPTAPLNESARESFRCPANLPPMRTSTSLLLLLALLIPALARAAPAAGPADVVKAFYSWYLAHPEDDGPLSKWVDPHLLAELALAEDRGQEDGNYLDFDPFTMSQAGFESFRIQKVDTRGDTALATVALEESRGHGAAPIEVTLKLKDGRWWVSNFKRPGWEGDVVSILDEINAPFRSGAAPAGVGAVAYSADGQLLAVGTDNGALLVTQEGVPLRRFNLPRPRAILSLGFLPDGRLWLQDSRYFRLLDLSTSKSREVAISPHMRIAVAPDGRWAAALGMEPGKEFGTSYGVMLLDLQALRSVAWLPFGSGNPADLGFSLDGRWLAAAEKGSIVVWDVARRERAVRLPGVDFSFLRFLPEGTLLSLDSAGILVEWEVPSGKQLRIGAAGVFQPVLWDVSPDGKRVLMATDDEGSRLWRDRTTRNPDVELKGKAVRFLPGGEVLLRREDAYLVWDGQAERPLSGEGEKMAVRPDGKFIVWPNASPAAADGSDLVQVVALP